MPTGTLLLAAALLLATLPAVAQPEPARPKPVMFPEDPILDGRTVLTCEGTSPAQNGCDRWLDPALCDGGGCQPDISGTFGFTGTIQALITGFTEAGQERALWKRCELVAGGGVSIGGPPVCGYGSDAPRVCDASGCHREMFPPLHLRGRATGFPTPSGPWKAHVVAP